MVDEDRDQSGAGREEPGRVGALPPRRIRSAEWWPPEPWGRGREPATWWHETCRPEWPPRFNLLSVGMGFMAGFAAALAVWPDPDGVPPPAPIAAVAAAAERPFIAGPRSSAVLLGRVAGPAGADEFPSEMADDDLAQWQAAAWRLQTESLLAATDIVRTWHLEAWREPLGLYQDAIVNVARLASAGGSWARHELLRNDLALERDLLAGHAAVLSADPEGGTEADPTERERRALRWASLWRQVETTADVRIRSAAGLEEAWKERLDPALAELREVHEELSALLLDLPDGRTADAVMDFCGGYFRETFAGVSGDPGGE